VSGDWPEDQYRAPEVGGIELTKGDFHVDLYSWGRILVRAATGYLTPPGGEGSLIDGAKLPPKVTEIAKECVAPVHKDRPRSIDEVLKAIRRWK
jgi:hypothetical protein